MADVDVIVSLEAIFLSTFVMIGQNRQADFHQAKADHEFLEQELELKTNTELTRRDPPTDHRTARAAHAEADGVRARAAAGATACGNQVMPHRRTGETQRPGRPSRLGVPG